MYSVVLMMAMTGGGDVPAGLFHNGCNGGGCYGSCYGGCYGGCTGGKHGHHGSSCYGGCYGGCTGGKHHGHTRSYGCCGGGKHQGHHRGHGCCGGGCYGSCYGGGCYGSNWGGCYGSGAGCIGGACYGSGAGCIGGAIGAPMAPVGPVNPAPATNPAPKKTSIDNAAPATLVVNVPAEAKLTIDGEATTSTSTQRVFVSPVLEIGRDYHYNVKVEFVKEGKVVSVSKDVAVRAGSETRVTLDAGNLAGVASR